MPVVDLFPDAIPSGSGFSALCPAHPDKRRSLSIAVRNGRVLIKCHAGCANSDVASALGFNRERALYKAIAGATDRKQKKLKIARLGRKKKRGNSLPESEILRHPFASYDYHDEQGQVLYSIDRYEWRGEKAIRPRLPDGSRQLGDVRRVPFALPTLSANAVVYLVEGEKKARALQDRRLVATTTVGGSASWKPHYADDLGKAGVREVIGMPDNDSAGLAYIHAAARDCTARGIRFRILALPGLGPKEDVVDWFAKGNTVEQLGDLSKNASTWQPESVDAGDLLADYVYSIGTKRFINLATFEQHDKEQFDALFAPKFHLRSGIPASAEFLNNATARRVADPTYRPGSGRFVSEDQRFKLNLYRASELRPQVGDVRPWLIHLRNLVPDRDARKTIKDWMAFTLQHLGNKINWALFIGGAQGIGKDALVAPFLRAVGMHNVAIISPEDLATGWTDWLKDSKLVNVQEFTIFEKKLLMNRLKPLLTSPPTKLRINAKFVPQYYIPNLANFIFFSNHRDALHLDADDRRFFVYWSNARPQPDAYYRELYAWIEKHSGVVFDYLLTRDISSFQATGQAPMTKDKLQIIRDSRSPIEHYLRNQFDTDSAPFDRDLVIINDLLDKLPKHVGHASARSVAQVLRKLGAKELSKQLRLSSGRPRVWAVRRIELYERLSEHELSAAYERNQIPEPLRRLWKQRAIGVGTFGTKRKGK